MLPSILVDETLFFFDVLDGLGGLILNTFIKV